MISSRLAGTDLITIGSHLQVLTIDAWAKPEIKSVTDLRGKSVAVTRIGASTYFAGLSMLESAGLKTSDVTFIQAGGVGESLVALLTGRVDAALQGTFEFYRTFFPTTLRTVDKAIANALRFLDHPKARQADPKQFFDNSLADEAGK